MYSGQPPYPGMYQPGASQGAGDTQETTYLYIPNNAVGAIIGTKGSHIRNIIRFSGASVKIAPLDQDKPQDTQTERKVTIVGSPESQWKVKTKLFTITCLQWFPFSSVFYALFPRTHSIFLKFVFPTTCLVHHPFFWRDILIITFCVHFLFPSFAMCHGTSNDKYKRIKIGQFIDLL